MDGALVVGVPVLLADDLFFLIVGALDDDGAFLVGGNLAGGVVVDAFLVVAEVIVLVVDAGIALLDHDQVPVEVVVALGQTVLVLVPGVGAAVVAVRAQDGIALRVEILLRGDVLVLVVGVLDTGVVLILKGDDLALRVVVGLTGLIAGVVIGHLHGRVAQLLDKKGLVRRVEIGGPDQVALVIVVLAHDGIAVLTGHDRAVRRVEALLHDVAGIVHDVGDLGVLLDRGIRRGCAAGSICRLRRIDLLCDILRHDQVLGLRHGLDSVSDRTADQGRDQGGGDKGNVFVPRRGRRRHFTLPGLRRFLLCLLRLCH